MAVFRAPLIAKTVAGLKGPEFLFPNFVLNAPAVVTALPFSYYEFSHPPKIQKADDLSWLPNPLAGPALIRQPYAPYTTTWNPSDKGADIVLSNNNLTASGSGGVNNTVRATTSNSGGKWYFEFALNNPGSNSNACVIGFATGNANVLSTYLSAVANTAGLAFEGGTAVGT